MFPIDKNIPIPPRTPTTRMSKFPLESMDVGDSFLIPIEDGRNISEEGNRVANVIRKWARRRGDGWKFSRRITSQGIRIWRIK